MIFFDFCPKDLKLVKSKNKKPLSYSTLPNYYNSSFIFFVSSILKARAETKKIILFILLVQMRRTKSVSEINWLLVCAQLRYLRVLVHFLPNFVSPIFFPAAPVGRCYSSSSQDGGGRRARRNFIYGSGNDRC